MHISPISVGVSRFNKQNIEFKGDRYNDNYNEEDFVHYDENDCYIADPVTTQRDKFVHNKGVKTGALLSFIATISAMAIAMGFGGKSHNDEEFISKIEQIYNSEDIQQDKLEIADVTEDKVPDIILYKKNGSKLVINVKDKIFMSEETSLKNKFNNEE